MHYTLWAECTGRAKEQTNRKQGTVLSVRKAVIWFRKASSYLNPHRAPQPVSCPLASTPYCRSTWQCSISSIPPGASLTITLLRIAEPKLLHPQNPHNVVPVTYISPPASPLTPPDDAGSSLYSHLSHHLLLCLAIFYLYFKFKFSSSTKLVRTSYPQLLLPFSFLGLSALAKISLSNLPN